MLPTATLLVCDELCVDVYADATIVVYQTLEHMRRKHACGAIAFTKRGSSRDGLRLELYTCPDSTL